MTIQSLQPNIVLPAFSHDGSNPTIFNLVLDAADEKAAYIGYATEDFTINTVHVRTRGVTTGADLDVRIETVGADGFPSGTLWATNTNATLTVQDTDDDVWLSVNLTATATISKGDNFAVVFVNPSSGTGNMALADWTGENQMMGYAAIDTGSWALTSLAGRNLAIRLENASNVFMYCMGSGPFTANTGSNTVTQNATPDEYGIRFQLPFKASLCGMAIWKGAFSGTFDLVVYNLSDTALETTSYDDDALKASIGPAVHLLLANPVTLEPDTEYRFVVKGTENGSGVQVRYWTYASASHKRGHFWGSTDVQATERTNAGAWTDTDTEVPFLGLIFEGFDDAAGAGGGGGRNPLVGPIG